MLETKFTDDEMHILNTIRGRQMLRSEDTMNIENLAADVIDGKRINLERGALGLSEASGKGEKKGESVDVMALIIGEEKPKGLEMERPAVVSVEALPQLAAH